METQDELDERTIKTLEPKELVDRLLKAQEAKKALLEVLGISLRDNAKETLPFAAIMSAISALESVSLAAIRACSERSE